MEAKTHPLFFTPSSILSAYGRGDLLVSYDVSVQDFWILLLLLLYPPNLGFILVLLSSVCFSIDRRPI